MGDGDTSADRDGAEAGPGVALCRGCVSCEGPTQLLAPGLSTALGAQLTARFAMALLGPCATASSQRNSDLGDLVDELDHIVSRLEMSGSPPQQPEGAPWPEWSWPALVELRAVVDHLLVVWTDQLTSGDGNEALVERLTRVTRMLRRTLVTATDSTLLGGGVGLPGHSVRMIGSTAPAGTNLRINARPEP